MGFLRILLVNAIGWKGYTLLFQNFSLMGHQFVWKPEWLNEWKPEKLCIQVFWVKQSIFRWKTKIWNRIDKPLYRQTIVCDVFSLFASIDDAIDALRRQQINTDTVATQRQFTIKTLFTFFQFTRFSPLSIQIHKRNMIVISCSFDDWLRWMTLAADRIFLSFHCHSSMYAPSSVSCETGQQ